MQPKLLEARDLFPDQQAAVETIMEFVEDPSASEMLVEGPAGSGKTSSIRVSINELPKAYRSGVVVCAPTNKAVKVARELSGGLVDTTTIYKLLSLSPQANGEVKEIRQGENAHQKLMATELVYLDEASMNGSVLKPFIRRAQEDYGIKFVYIADRYQLPPVGEDLSWVFREVRSRVVLDKVKRHDNQILNLATHLREVIDGNAKLKVADDFTEEHGGIELFTRSKAFDERILDTWEATRREAGDAEPDFSGSRVLAWRNQAVGGYNDLVREMLYGRREARDNPLMVGERVVVCNPVLSLQEDNVTLMHTDEEGFIEKISIRPHPKYPEIECFALVVLRESTGTRQAAILKVSLAGAVTALGGAVGYVLVDALHAWLPYFLALASSSFIYVALADLIPQLQKRLSARETLAQVFWLAAGMGMVTAVGLLVH